MDVTKIQEKKAALEEELRRTERQIYELEGEYLQVRLECSANAVRRRVPSCNAFASVLSHRADRTRASSYYFYFYSY